MLVLAAGLAAAGCGGSDAPDSDDGGASNQGGAGNGDEGGAGGTDGGAGAEDPGEPIGFPCENFAAPGALITDFSSWAADGTWGDDSSLTGGSFYYDGDSEDGDALTATVADEALTVTGDVEEYAGFGLWFGPCLDASEYSGISFTISGDLSDTQVEFQVQSSSNYPISTTDQKGECDGDWSSGCVSNSYILDAEVGEEPVTVEIPWSELVGGQPTAPIDSTEVLGIQWQFNCPSGETCSPNVVIDDVVFYE